MRKNEICKGLRYLREKNYSFPSPSISACADSAGAELILQIENHEVDL